MALNEDLSRIAVAAAAYAGPGEKLAAVIPTEPGAGARVYLCAFGHEGDGQSWLALDDAGRPVSDRRLLRDAVSIAAMCELVEETAAGGKLEELRARLVSLRITESPTGIEAAEDAALALERAIGSTPRLATPAYLDAVGGATRRLEEALGEGPRSPFTEAMKLAVGTVEELTKEIESSYKRELQ